MKLDEELTAAMRSHVAGTRLTADVVAAAGRANRRRRAVRRGAFAAGGLTLATAAAVTGVVAMSGSPGTVSPAPPAQVALQPAGYVASHVSEALDRNSAKITYVTVRQTSDAGPYESEQWWDGATGDWRRHAKGADALIKYSGEHATFTMVDHTTRTWWAITYKADTSSSEGWSKDDIKAALKKQGSFEVIGKESLDGRGVLHLRVAGAKDKGSNLELWVDASSYDLVRTVETYRPSGGGTASVDQWDYTYLPRTEEGLTRFALEPPAGYTRNQADAPQKSNAEPAN